MVVFTKIIEDDCLKPSPIVMPSVTQGNLHREMHS